MELKAETIVPQGSAITLQMYPKAEADKVIAELKDKLKVQTSNAEEGWKEYRIYHTSYAEAVNELYEKNKQLRHQKYKWCLAMARQCKRNRLHACVCGPVDKIDFWNKWHNRWLELAEKFKPNKEADDGND